MTPMLPTSQPAGWKVGVHTGSFLPHSPKNSDALLFPYREICTHKNPRGIPSFHLGDRISRLRDVSGRALASQIPDIRRPINTDLFLSGFSLYCNFGTCDAE
jgi:hypothetical protein